MKIGFRFIIFITLLANRVLADTSINTELADIHDQIKIITVEIKKKGCRILENFQIVAKIEDKKYEVLFLDGMELLPCPGSMGNCPAQFGPKMKRGILLTIPQDSIKPA